MKQIPQRLPVIGENISLRFGLHENDSSTRLRVLIIGAVFILSAIAGWLIGGHY